MVPKTATSTPRRSPEAAMASAEVRLTRSRLTWERRIPMSTVLREAPVKPRAFRPSATSSASATPSSGTQGPGWSESYMTRGRQPTLPLRPAAATVVQNAATSAAPVPATPPSSGNRTHALTVPEGAPSVGTPSTPGFRVRRTYWSSWLQPVAAAARARTPGITDANRFIETSFALPSQPPPILLPGGRIRNLLLRRSLREGGDAPEPDAVVLLEDVGRAVRSGPRPGSVQLAHRPPATDHPALPLDGARRVDELHPGAVVVVAMPVGAPLLGVAPHVEAALGAQVLR